MMLIGNPQNPGNSSAWIQWRSEASGFKLFANHTLAPSIATGHVLHCFELHLLDLAKTFPLTRSQVVHLFVQVPNLELGLEIDPVLT
jgi:hypothetical protein